METYDGPAGHNQPAEEVTMSGTSVIKQLPPKDMTAELRMFIAGASRPSSGNQFELVRKSISLLKSLPASKDAVLEYLSSIFDKSVSSYMNELESNSQIQILTQPKEEAIIDEIYNSLTSFVSSSCEFWPPVISKWALSMLGTLSSKYSGRGRAPVNGMLSDSLQQWMSCRATRTLVDINTYCINESIKNAPALTELTSYSDFVARCFTGLLDVCVQYNPHFDWVVAHVGSCFPGKVIEHVLSWGLNDFSQNDLSTGANKLNSAIGILIHLAGSHLPEIKLRMLHLFQWSLTATNSIDDKSYTMKMAVIPFLMQLASHSPILLSALSGDTLQYFAVTPSLFRQLHRFTDQWIRFTGGRQALLDLVVHLILCTDDSAECIMTLLLDATENSDEVSDVAEEILELLVKELDVSVRVNGAKVPLLDCILKKVQWLLPLLICGNELKVSTAVTILSLIGQQQPSVLSNCVSFILLRSSNDDHLASVVKLTQGYKASQVLSPAIALSLSSDHLKDSYVPHLFWTNMSKLLKWEASGTLTSLPMQEAVWDNLVPIAELLYNTKFIPIDHSIAEVTKRAVLGSKSQPSVHLIMALVQATVSYFYNCLIQSKMEQLKGLRLVNSLLGRVSQCSTAARSMAIRELLESALFAAPSVLFGAIPEPGKRLVQLPSSLLKDHHKQGTTMLLGQRLSSVFHAGVIGNGKRKLTPTCPTPVSQVVHNTHLFIMALKACCTNENPQGTLDAVISLALLLVELISPDVMYNGLPWPEEEFCKVTVERDLYIRHAFDSMPLLWSLLEYIAYHRPALCYCSVLLRALVATLLGQWSSASQQGQESGQCKMLISTTTRVLQLMALSQLLPPPLHALSDVIPLLPPNQIMLVLRECVWNYMRDHVPSPALFIRDSNGAMWRDPSTSRPAKQYTETLRLVMQRNISSLGPLFNTLFVHDLHDMDDD